MAKQLTDLTQTLAGRPEGLAIAVAEMGPQFTRAALQRTITDVAARLAQAGLKPGDVVCLAFANTVEFIISFLAVTYARGVAAPLNPAYKRDEHAFYLEDSKAVLLLVPPEGNTTAQEAAATHGVPVASVSIQSQGAVASPLVHLKPLTAGGFSFLAPGSRPLPSGPLATDVALFLHTSGTTGRPKGVPLTHGNLAASLSNITQTYELVPSDVSYLVMPLFHVHGLMAGLLSPLAAGAAVVLPAAGRFTAHAFWKDCVEHGATFYTAVPTIHQVLLARAVHEYPAGNPPPLRFIRSCSSALAPATLEKLEATFKVPVLEAYAMTEASHQMTSNPLPSRGPHKPGTVGTAQGGMSVAILDGSNRLLPPGQIGEVCIRGSNVTAGYLKNPKANEEAFAGGWFHTGDQGFLDAQGYLTLTGRIKELINRGGEKISPLEVDAALLTHPAVAEAVSFGAPDDKYGEVVAAAVVLKPGAHRQGVEESIRQDVSKRLATFKVPGQIFITDVLPKTATGKIQRRHMVTTFITNNPAVAAAGGGNGGGTPPGVPPATAPPGGVAAEVAGLGDGYELVSRALAALGVRLAFGVVGIPITPLASSLQAAGIRFVGFRNEQAAGYAAAASGFLTGTPAVLLTVSGPGAVHGIAGASHATVNCWPLIMISGACEQGEVGKGAFQELDQVEALRPHCKWVGRPHRQLDLPQLLAQAYQHSLAGRPGAAYVDLPSNLLLQRIPPGKLQQALAGLGGATSRPAPTAPPPASVEEAARVLRSATRPLVVVGKGAALARAEEPLQRLVNQFGLPVLCTAMGRGLVPDSHPLCVNAARSAALREADVALVVGARLNWQLHFGEAPRWAPNAKFLLLDTEPSPRDASLAVVVLRGDASMGLAALACALAVSPAAPRLDPAGHLAWVQRLSGLAQAAGTKLAKGVAAAPQAPLDYWGALGTLRQVIQQLVPAPVVASEGANTMDMARLLLPVVAPRTRLDAGTWGTMGVGLGYAIAAACCAQPGQVRRPSLPGAGWNAQPGQVVFAVEGDSAFGFSSMELETMQRYKLPIVVVVMNNGGIYGGDRRELPLITAAKAGAAAGGFGQDLPPTSFVPGSRYDQLMQAFGGAGLRASDRAGLLAALQEAVGRAQTERLPTLVEVVLDPLAGVESGNVHAFNAPSKSKL